MSEILPGKQSATTPVLWRTVQLSSTQEDTARATEQELERQIEEARQAGFAEGLESGRAEAQRQLPATLENISESLAELEQIRERLRRASERELIRLAVTVATRVIHRETVLDSNAMAGLVKAAYSKVQSREISRVRMHPAVEPVVSRTLEECGGGGVVLMPDPNLNAGELFFETSQGVLDASLHTQLAEIERALLVELGSGRGISSI